MEREDRMSDEEGDGVEGEGGLAPPDCRGRAGPQQRTCRSEARRMHRWRHLIGKELPWRDVRKAREQELKCFTRPRRV